MRRLLVLVMLTASGLAVAATASAFTQQQKVSHSLLVCLRGNTLGGNGDGAGPIAAGSSLYLRIGYGATTRPEVNDFLAAQSGTFTVRDSGGNPVKSVSWATGNTQYWTAPKQAVLHNAQG